VASYFAAMDQVTGGALHARWHAESGDAQRRSALQGRRGLIRFDI